MRLGLTLQGFPVKIEVYAIANLGEVQRIQIVIGGLRVDVVKGRFDVTMP